MIEETLEAPCAEVENCITFANLSGDITLTWDDRNAEKIKDLIRKKMAEGYTFFTTRKVPLTDIPYKRKLGPKGVDSATDLIIDDAIFDKLVAGIDDHDVASMLKLGAGKLVKRGGDQKKFAAEKRAKTPEEVIEAKQAVAVRPRVGG